MEKGIGSVNGAEEKKRYIMAREKGWRGRGSRYLNKSE
jgi:hypothetical protein